MKKYISDIFGEKEMNSLEIGDSVAIWSQTGSGKSYFVKNILSKYCSEKGWKCLLISNRKILRSQNEKELRFLEYGNSVDTVNYQELEIDFHGDFKSLFFEYKVIVFDEAHYLLSDSEFNRNTDIIFKMMMNPPEDKICFFMTATPEPLEYCGAKFKKVYRLEPDYSYIEDVYFYSKDETADQILSSIPAGQKAIYFCSTAIDAYEKSLNIPSASFICSENNISFFKRSSMEERANIIAKEKFESKVLCCTKVLDNGVNIKDDSVQHIIIDMLDPTTFIQCLGRKRILNEFDKVKLYIRDFPKNQISFAKRKYSKQVGIAEELFSVGKEEFIRRYKKRSIEDIIDNDMTVNMAKYYHCKFLIDEMDKMINMGYRQYICEKIFYDLENVKNAEMVFEKKSLVDILDIWAGYKMFDDEQEKFKNEFFDNIFNSKSKNYRRRGLKSINAIMEEDGIGYVLVSKRENKGKNRNKRYWQIIKY